jgi:hypothetical protein
VGWFFTELGLFLYICIEIIIYLTMSSRGRYLKEVELYHNEDVLAVNLETGEYRDIPRRKNNIPDGSVVFNSKALFKKDYQNTWFFLKGVLSPLEYKAAHSLTMMAKANTGSLEPISDESTIKQLMEVLDVSKNKVKPIMDKLFELGVYGKFEAYKPERPYTKYWLINPYLSFSGKIIKSDIQELFNGTHCEKAFYDDDYLFKYKVRYSKR